MVSSDCIERTTTSLMHYVSVVSKSLIINTIYLNALSQEKSSVLLWVEKVRSFLSDIIKMLSLFLTQYLLRLSLGGLKWSDLMMSTWIPLLLRRIFSSITGQPKRFPLIPFKCVLLVLYIPLILISKLILLLVPWIILRFLWWWYCSWQVVFCSPGKGGKGGHDCSQSCHFPHPKMVTIVLCKNCITG